jgi:uncharacterized membrane protein
MLPQFVLALVFFLGGVIMAKYPPKKINPVYGYRSMASMRHKDAWDYAQRLASRKFVLVSIVMFVIAFAEWLLDVQPPVYVLIMLGTMILSVVYVFQTVEKQLAKRFPQN